MGRIEHNGFLKNRPGAKLYYIGNDEYVWRLPEPERKVINPWKEFEARFREYHAA